MIDPRKVLSKGNKPRQPRQQRDSPSFDLARLRWRQKTMSQESVDRWTYIVNAKWLEHYTNVYHRDQKGQK